MPSELSKHRDHRRTVVIVFLQGKGFFPQEKFCLEVSHFITAHVLFVNLSIYCSKCRAQTSQTVCVSLQGFFISAGGLKV